MTARVLIAACAILAALLVRENARARRAEQWADAVANEAVALLEEATR